MQSRKRSKKRKTETLQGVGLKVLIPVFLALFGLLFCLILGMNETRKLAEQYTEDTAGLYVEQINKDIFQINNEFIQVLGKSKIGEIPEYVNSSKEEYYELLGEIREQNRLLKIRYKEVQSFFVYAKEPDIFIGDGGTVFAESQVDGFLKDLRDFSREAVDGNYGITTWDILKTRESTYVIGWYAKSGKLIGCIMDLEKLFSLLEEMTQRYKVIPFMKEKNGGIIHQARFSDEKCFEEKIENLKKSNLYEFQLGTVGKMCVYVFPDGGILEAVLEMQTILVILIIVLLLLCTLFTLRYYQHLMEPLRKFVQGISNMQEEQMLNENGENNILELEAVSDQFRILLRKIQSLKIAIYEKELSEKKAELEYMQEQIRPHFFLNCLSLIHGIADKQREEKIIYITKTLSEYIRYNYKDSGEKRKLKEEIEHVKKYMELQKLRYGDNAFTFEVIEEDMTEAEIPSLILQTLVENSVVHSVNLDYLVEISLYITRENYGKQSYLYICVSDTGTGFSKEILEAFEKDTPIIYGGRKHIGLQNVKRRLELLYSGKASMTIQNMSDHYGAVVEIRIPQ